MPGFNMPGQGVHLRDTKILERIARALEGIESQLTNKKASE